MLIVINLEEFRKLRRNSSTNPGVVEACTWEVRADVKPSLRVASNMPQTLFFVSFPYIVKPSDRDYSWDSYFFSASTPCCEGSEIIKPVPSHVMAKCKMSLYIPLCVPRSPHDASAKMAGKLLVCLRCSSEEDFAAKNLVEIMYINRLNGRVVSVSDY